MRKILTVFLAFAIVAFNGFMLLEGGMVKAETSSSMAGVAAVNWDVYLDVGSEIAITCTVDGAINMGAINGLTGGTVNGTKDCNVETNNDTGWKLDLAVTSTPAMTTASGNGFADATTTPGAWAITSTAASQFGFSVTSTGGFGQGGLGNGADYRGFTGASAIIVTQDTSETATGGVTTTINFRAQAGADRNQPTGHYNAHVIATASTI